MLAGKAVEDEEFLKKKHLLLQHYGIQMSSSIKHLAHDQKPAFYLCGNYGPKIV